MITSAVALVCPARQQAVISRITLFIAVLVVTSSQTVRAADLVATKPGLMCQSADALARLTLPDGSSRTSSTSPLPKDLRAKFEGNCIDIRLGEQVSVVATRRNTSIVRYAGREGVSAGTFIIPNIDFTSVPSNPEAPLHPAPSKAPGSKSAVPDIMGIAAGQSLATVRTHIPAGFTEAQYFAGWIPGDKAYKFESPDGGEFFIVALVAGAAYYVRHVKAYGEDNGPNFRTLVAGLRRRYGKPILRSGPEPPNFAAVWGFDLRMNPLQVGTSRDAKSHFEECTSLSFMSDEPGDNVAAGLKSGCGPTITVTVSSSSTSSAVVRSLDISLEDPRPVVKFRLTQQGGPDVARSQMKRAAAGLD